MLKENGIVTRTIFATVTPTVEYDHTEKGGALEKVIIEVRDWEKFICKS